jgi:phosphomannomutase
MSNRKGGIMGLFFGTDGMRGIVDKEIDCLLATKV